METTLLTTDTNRKEKDQFRTISLTALLTGTLYLIAANIQFYFNTQRGAALKFTGAEEPVSFISYLSQGGPCYFFKYIAGAVFGPEAYAGGTLMIVWGVVFHYIIAFLFTLCFFVAYTKTRKLLHSQVMVVVAYGLLIWTVMTLVVVPLSKIGELPGDWETAVTGWLTLTAAVALPVALIAGRFYADHRKH